MLRLLIISILSIGLIVSIVNLWDRYQDLRLYLKNKKDVYYA